MTDTETGSPIRNNRAIDADSDVKPDSEASSDTGTGTDGRFVQTVEICNRRGLHARASAKFVKLTCTFNAQVTVTRDDQTVAGTSIMGLLVLGAAPGCEIKIAAEGPEAEAALSALVELVTGRFGEE